MIACQNYDLFLTANSYKIPFLIHIEHTMRRNFEFLADLCELGGKVSAFGTPT